MTTVSRSAFHDGELAVQRRAGVGGRAARLTGMLAPPTLTGGAAFFLADRDLAALTARDADGRLWTVLLRGAPGFLDVVDDATLDVLALPEPGGPLAGPGGGLERGRQAGLLAVDFAARRRFRVNGTVAATGPTGFALAADQAYGNCPQYIQRRRVTAVPAGGAAARVRWSDGLDADAVRLITRADTFLLGTDHPTRGADTSHRGGAPGFVRVEDGALWWPDYPGNNMFNSLGNITADGAAALLFLDFGTGAALHLSGTAVVEWTTPGGPGDDGGTGRRVRFTPRRTATTATRLRATGTAPYPPNPPQSPPYPST
ncbi:MAG TPA: pyridoxamine 5'-phosphate oxidase family protein [Streptomyces sp.]